MKKLAVTLNGLNGSVSFCIIQNGNVLVEDTVVGKLTQPYTKIYNVQNSEGALIIEHNSDERQNLTITAELL